MSDYFMRVLAQWVRGQGYALVKIERFRELCEKEIGYDAIEAQSAFLYNDIEAENADVEEQPATCSARPLADQRATQRCGRQWHVVHEYGGTRDCVDGTVDVNVRGSWRFA